MKNKTLNLFFQKISTIFHKGEKGANNKYKFTKASISICDNWQSARHVNFIYDFREIICVNQS